ncbi:MAG: hypothetical protein FJ044_03005 [Candidatus Cloacimonetes bacterium]|nr:hypothetical protein [Candidatus Cloacimonadota bacterium]
MRGEENLSPEQFLLLLLEKEPRLVLESFEKVNQGMRDLGFSRGWPIFGVVFVPASSEKRLIPLWQNLMSARCKVVELFLRDSSVRPIFGFTTDEEELIVNDPFLTTGDIYEGKIKGLPLIAIARLDGFVGTQFPNGYSNNEGNTGEPGGMDYHDVIGDSLWETVLGQELRRHFQLRRFTIREALVRTALRHFEVWNNKQAISKPKAAVVIGANVDREVGLVAAGIERFLPTNVAAVDDPNWDFNGKSLRFHRKEVGLLIRTSSAEINLLAEAAGPVTKALLTGAVLAVPTISGRVGGNKVADFFLSQKQDMLGLTKDEFRAVQSIPRTVVAAPEAINWAIQHQQDLILKPNLGGGGQDAPGGRGIPVTFGGEVSVSRWRELQEIASASNTRRYVNQKVVPITRGEFVSVQDEDLGLYEVAWGLDPYMFAGRFVGYAARGVVNPPNNHLVKLNVGDGIAHSGCIYTVL